MPSKYFSNAPHINEPRREKTCLMPYANNKRADKPAHPRSLISAYVVRWLDSIIPVLAKSKIAILRLVSLAEQTGLCLIWSQTPKTGFFMTLPTSGSNLG